MNFFCTGTAQNLHQTAACRSAHNRIVYNNNALSVQIAFYGIQFNKNHIFALFLSRRNKRSSYIFIFYNSHRIRNARNGRISQRRPYSAVRNAYYNIRFNRIFLSKHFSHFQTRILHRNSINNRIRTGKIHVLKNTRLLGSFFVKIYRFQPV